MTTKKKLLIAAVVVVGISSTVGYSIFARNRGVIAVQAGRVSRQDLTQTVSANGEIKPKKDVNVSSNMMGRIDRLPVKEGDRVRTGDLLVQLESIQSEADVKAAEASLDAAQADVEGMAASIRSADAAVNSAKADLARSEADLARAKQDLDRDELMTKEGLIAKQQHDKTKADYEIAVAALNSAKAHLAQAEAQAAQSLNQRDSTFTRIAQQRASLTRAKDQYSKTTIRSPLDGVITYLPVNEGEIAIVGVQNSAGTVLMTIADMSVITAEVQVDETDIVNVKIGQEARVKVDALGDKVLMGHVSEVGNSALNRSGSTTTSTTTGAGQEAKDFKVVVTLDDPPQELRPGLSATATIVTATRQNVLTIPIQALTIREFDADGKTPSVETQPDPNAAPNADKDRKADLNKKKTEKEGFFTVKNGIALFRAVKTGITGTTDIEVLDGIGENEDIVTGPY